MRRNAERPVALAEPANQKLLSATAVHVIVGALHAEAALDTSLDNFRQLRRHQKLRAQGQVVRLLRLPPHQPRQSWVGSGRQKVRF